MFFCWGCLGGALFENPFGLPTRLVPFFSNSFSVPVFVSYLVLSRATANYCLFKCILASRRGKRAQKTPNTTKSWEAEQKNPRIPPVAAAAPWSCEVARLLLLIAYLIIRGGPGEMEEGENLTRTIPTSNPDPDQEQGGLGVWCGVKSQERQRAERSRALGPLAISTNKIYR